MWRDSWVYASHTTIVLWDLHISCQIAQKSFLCSDQARSELYQVWPSPQWHCAQQSRPHCSSRVSPWSPPGCQTWKGPSGENDQQGSFEHHSHLDRPNNVVENRGVDRVISVCWNLLCLSQRIVVVVLSTFQLNLIIDDGGICFGYQILLVIL